MSRKKIKLARKEPLSYIDCITTRFLMSTKQKLGFISISLATTVSAMTIFSFVMPVPYKAGVAIERLDNLESDVGEIKEDLAKVDERTTITATDVAYIRGQFDSNHKNTGE